jgi:hypothetical protein
MDEYDDSGGKLGPYLFATLGAFLGDVCIHAHGGAADTAELGVVVPIEQFLALASLEVEGAWEFVIALTQSAHLKALMSDDRGINAVGDDGGAIMHRGDVHLVSPRLNFRGRLFLKGYGVDAVSGTF